MTAAFSFIGVVFILGVALPFILLSLSGNRDPYQQFERDAETSEEKLEKSEGKIW